MTLMPPATREEVAALLGDVDDSYVDRVLDTGASLDEIGEAIDDLEGKLTEPRHVPSTVSVAEVHEILEELFDASATPRTFPLRGMPVGHPV
jgi:hypothetical protein